MLFSVVFQRDEIERGQVLAKARHNHIRTPKFKGQVYVSDERKKADVILRSSQTTDLSSTSEQLTLPAIVNLPEGTEMCMPGDNVTMDVELITPIAIETGLRFAIREGGRTVGSGVVTEIVK